MFASCVGYFDRAYSRVLGDLIKNVSPYLGGQNLTAVQLSVYKYVAVCRQQQ